MLGAVRSGKPGLLHQSSLIWQSARVKVKACCRIGRCEVIEYPVSCLSMSVKTEVPILPREFHIDTEVERRSRTFACHISIPFRDHAISVKVHKFILNRIALGIILLSVGVVGIWSITHHLSAQISSCSFRNGSCLQVIIVILGCIQLSELRVLERSIQTQLHIPVAALHRHSAHRNLDTLIPYRAHIRHQTVAEIRSHRDLHRIQKILCISYICIHTTIESILKETKIKTQVIRSRSLPLYHRIIGLRSQHIHKPFSSHIVLIAWIVGEIVACQVNIITYAVLLTCHTDRDAQLQCRKLRILLHERLLGNIPSKCSRREESPSMLLCKLA